MVSRLASLIGEVREECMSLPGLSVWARTQRTLQPVEAWETFRPWIEATNPRMAFAVARNLISGSQISASDRAWAVLIRREARARLGQLLKDGAILCLPTTPFPAPTKGQTIPALDILRDQITCLSAHGGLTGVPQVTIPGSTVNGSPVGLSIVGAHGTDAMLVAAAKAMEGRG
jgi:amidase